MLDRVRTPVLVAVTIALVFVANALYGGEGETVQLYKSEPDRLLVWHRDVVPRDRWVGILLDAEGWRRLPAEVGLRGKQLVDGTTPDFTREVAVVAYMGAMPTGGYDLHITGVEYTAGQSGKGRLTVRLSVGSPSPDLFVTQAFTRPIDTAVVPKDALPDDVLAAAIDGRVIAEAIDQDGRDWGPVHILSGASNDVL